MSAIAGAAFGLTAASAARADDYFINTSGGDWGTAANWSNNAAPTFTDDAFLGYDFGGVTFADPSSLTVTLSKAPLTANSLYSKSNLQLVSANLTSTYLHLNGSTLTLDPSVSLSMSMAPGATIGSAGLEIQPAAGTTFTLNANINQSTQTGTHFGTQSAPLANVIYGAGYTWNVSGPMADNTGAANANIDAIYAPLTLNGTLNLTNGGVAAFGNTSMTTPALTIGANGLLASNGASWRATTLDNQGIISLIGGSASLFDNTTFTNSGTFSVNGGGVVSNFSGSTINTGSIVVSDAGSKLELANISGSGSVTAKNNGELDLLGFNTSLLDHITVLPGGKVAIGGTITTAPGATFDYTRLGSNVIFGIDNAGSNVSFSGGTVIHSNQLANVVGLDNVTLDHGLGVFHSGAFAFSLDISDAVNAGDTPITINGGTIVTIHPGAVLNGDLAFTTNGSNSTFRTLNIGGTLNGNFAAAANGIVTLNGNAKLVGAFAVNPGVSVEVDMLNGHLAAGSNLSLVGFNPV